MSEIIKAIIIDDEKLAREIIKKYLDNFPQIQLLAECSNGFEALKKSNEVKPDIIFLDIQMPKLTGFEMLELMEEKPVIIFTTAYDQYALKAFEVNAADYLLKPFSKERFEEAVNKGLKRLTLGSDKKVIEKIIKHNQQQAENIERVVVKDGPEIHIIPVHEIKWIEAQDDYVMVHSSKGKFLKQQRMKYFESHLDPKEFIRVHRSFIVAIKEIKKLELLEKETFQVYLSENISLPVSRTGYDKLKEILK